MRRTDAKDNKKRYFRAGDRIVNQNSVWYFSAREGDVGPFQTRSVAEQEVQRFLVERQQLGKFQLSRQEQCKEQSKDQCKDQSKDQSKEAPKQALKPAPKPVAKRVQAASATQQRRHHLDQTVESDALMLTLDDDFLL